MVKLTLTPLAVEHVPALFAFEAENRTFFERAVGARPDTYWDQDKLHDLVCAQVSAGDLMYLLWCDGALVGRVNLTRDEAGGATLGYRVGEQHNGKGLATAGVALVKTRALELGLTHIEAAVLPDNLASARVLKSNGFHYLRGGSIGEMLCNIYRIDLGAG